jgi:seryl-tRNA synthetase
MLSPTVCHHLYLALAGETLPSGGLTATAECHCFRYESSNMVSLERLWNFTMREIVFVGEPDFVADGLDEVRRLAQPIFADLGLAYSIETASDPFFVDTFRDQTSFQNAYLLKFEIRALLPFKDDTIAAGSYNRHLDFFGRELDIRLADGSPAHTGCVGFGFERLCLAFVAQHGPDPVHWPDPVRQHLAR